MAVETKAGGINVTPMAIRKVGIVGGGAMGGGIAQVVSSAGLPVIIKDLSQDLVDKGVAAAHEVYDRRVKKGKIDAVEAAQKKALISGATAYEAFSDCDLVIEAVTEKMSVKKQVFAELSGVLPAHAIIASNTSALSITELARATNRPDKVAGLHYFNPAPVMPLVEVIRGQATSDETIATVMAFCRHTEKKPILINRDEAGFLVNRLLLAFANEAVLALQENGPGVMAEIDRQVAAKGFPMGPFTLMDMVGVDVCAHVMHTLHDAFSDRFPQAQLLDRMLNAGRWGQKRGAGFYSKTDAETKWLEEAIAEIQRQQHLKPTPVSFERFIAVMINEAARMVMEKTVAQEDIDPAMRMGTGMAKGPFEIADMLGIDTVLDVLRKHQDLGLRFQPVALLEQMSKEGKLGCKSGAGFYPYARTEGTLRQYVNYVLSQRVATVTMERPPANALSTALLQELEACIDELAANPDCKAIVLTGGGKKGFFVAGADINEIAEITEAEKAIAWVSKVNAFFCRMENLDKPVIAAINGFCLGGGLELAMACHVRYASENAKLGQPEINLGIIPGYGGTQRLSRIIGLARATEWLLTGDMFTAQEAFALGLVNKVAPADQLLGEAQALATKIASKGRVAIAGIMAALRVGRDLPLAKGLEVEALQFGRVVESEDKRIGVSAFLNKVANPQFVDR